MASLRMDLVFYIFAGRCKKTFGYFRSNKIWLKLESVITRAQMA